MIGDGRKFQFFAAGPKVLVDAVIAAAQKRQAVGQQVDAEPQPGFEALPHVYRKWPAAPPGAPAGNPRHGHEPDALRRVHGDKARF